MTSMREWQTLEHDLDTLVNWAEKLQINIKTDKYEVLHVGSNKTKRNKHMNAFQLSNVEKEKS